MSAASGVGVSAPAFVLGFADCLDDDLAAAEKIFPDAVRFGVNRAAQRHHCRHLVAIDRHKIAGFLPDYPITVHTGRFGGVNQSHGPLPHIDCYWPHLQPGGTSGSSGWLAVKIAVKLGHEPVVMCGCPIDDSPHVAPENDGRCLWRDNPRQVPTCREFIEQDREYHPYARSMSGWTRDLLGGP